MSPNPSESRTVPAYDAVVELHARYADTLDRKDVAGLAACFAPDAVLVVGEQVAAEGGRTIAERLTSRSDPAVLHIPFPPAVCGVEGSRLRTRSYFQLVDTRTGRITALGTYEDEMTSTDQAVVLTRRSVTYAWKEATP
ncbi:nuclear transport factor 2 family protein [Nocardioides humi]|uniref:SnoaL-like domain-containing protein n=1 Tax=Nocardioides humi TaxID=449461 RepID=A0ABN2A7K7_9ACTN|nr:nuclear transport factor 2 family protein [Nocardioides humi]